MQAFSYGGAAFALQFHMDVTHAMMCRWTTRGHARMEMPGAKPRDAHFEGRLLHDTACRAWLAEFLDHWLERRNRRGRSQSARPRGVGRLSAVVASSVSTQ